MDNELIVLMAMCNTPEIQAKWEPKKGDQFIAEYALWTVGDATFRYTGKDNEVPVKEKYPVPAQACPEGWGCKEEMIFIPRIEDVLEWLREHALSPKILAREMITLEQPIKALLKAYMILEHNKTWNGEVWV